MIIRNLCSLQLQCLQLLLAEGCDVNIVDSVGVTAQRVAEIYGHRDCVKAIVEWRSTLHGTQDVK